MDQELPHESYALPVPITASWYACWLVLNVQHHVLWSKGCRGWLAKLYMLCMHACMFALAYQ